MDLRLTEDQVQFRELARDFVDNEVVPFRRDWDRAEAVDRSLLAKLGSAGFLGLTIGEEYGGSGGDYLSYALVTEELGRADSAVRGLVSVSLGLVGKTIAVHGNDEQRRRWLPRITSGVSLGCFALTEPDTGSDAANLQTRAVRDGDDYLLTGSKMFITNGVWADLALVFARTGGAGPKGISAFLVPTGSAGFDAVEITGKLGLRGQPTAQLYLSEVRVPAAARLGEEGRGFGIAMAALDRGRMSVAAGCVGIVQGCLDAAVSYARERHQFGKPIASFQLVQEMIAEMAVDADAGRLLVWRVVDLIERCEPFSIAASKAKYFASEAAVRAANNAIQVFGGYGYVDEYPVAKFLRDARVMTLYEGTSQVQKLLIGRAATGISAFI